MRLVACKIIVVAIAYSRGIFGVGAPMTLVSVFFLASSLDLFVFLSLFMRLNPLNISSSGVNKALTSDHLLNC